MSLVARSPLRVEWARASTDVLKDDIPFDWRRRVRPIRDQLLPDLFINQCVSVFDAKPTTLPATRQSHHVPHVCAHIVQATPVSMTSATTTMATASAATMQIPNPSPVTQIPRCENISRGRIHKSKKVNVKSQRSSPNDRTPPSGSSPTLYLERRWTN